jgi:hypothetical protein
MENQEGGLNFTPTKSDTLFEDMGKNMKVLESTAPPVQPPAEPPAAPPAAEPIINNDQQFQEALKTQLGNPEPVTPPPAEEKPKSYDLFETKPQEVNYQTAFEKAEAERNKLLQQLQSEPEWVKELKQLSAHPEFDINKWAKELAGETFDHLSLEQLVEKDMAAKGIPKEDIEAEIDRLKSAGYYERNSTEERLRAQLNSSAKPKSELAQKIKAHQEQNKEQFAQEEKMLEEASSRTQELLPKLEGKTFGAYTITKEDVAGVHELIFGQGFMFREKDGSIPVERIIQSAFVANNLQKILAAERLEAVKEAESKFILERSNPSQGNQNPMTRALPVVNDPDKKAWGEYLDWKK